MSDPRHNFVTHRCEAMPRGLSLRKYRSNRDYRRRCCVMGGWILSVYEYDYELLHPYMQYVAKVNNCPWCGRDLSGKVEP